METQRQNKLSFTGNSLWDSNRRTVAEISTNLQPECITAYGHLFSTAPELLDCLEHEVRLALEEHQRMMPKPTLTGYRPYSNLSTYPSLPGWVDRAVQAIAIAYDEPSMVEDADLCVAADDPNRLEDNDGRTIVRVSKELNKDVAREYVCLFLAARELLSIVEGMTNDGFQLHNEGHNVESDHKYVIPDRLRRMSDLAAKAKGAIPL